VSEEIAVEEKNLTPNISETVPQKSIIFTATNGIQARNTLAKNKQNRICRFRESRT